MKKLYILGSGFTKAFSQKSPTLDDIIKNLNSTQINEKIYEYQNLKINGSEEISSLLLDTLYDCSIDESISRKQISYLFLKEIVKQFFDLKPDNEQIFVDLINQKFKSNSSEDIYIATFNYDLLIEDNSKLYDYLLPINYNPYEDNQKAKGAFGTYEKYIRILKLHGSINWYCNHNEIFNLSNTFFISKKDKSLSFIMSNNLPVLVPFVFNKSYFMNGDLFTSIWKKMDMLLQDVDEIEIVGYGFPKTDYQIFPKILKYIDKIKRVIVLEDKNDRLNEYFGTKLFKGDAKDLLLK